MNGGEFRQRVLVTGADGQLGRALRRLAPAGAQVFACGRSDLDVTNRVEVARRVAELRPDWIVNAAAFTAVDAAEAQRELAFAVNRDGAANLAAAASANGARLLQVSTDYVFDGRQGSPYVPDDVPAPLGIYGQSKHAGEQAARDTLGERALVVRTAWLYSAGAGNFVHTMLRLLAERDEVAVVDDQVGSPTWADHLAAALWRALAVNLTGIHHWTDAGVASWYDFAVAIAEEASALGLLHRSAVVRPIPSAQYPLPALRPAYGVLNCAATHAALGDALSRPHWRVALRAMLKEKGK